jgi:hypothetical protein
MAGDSARRPIEDKAVWLKGRNHGASSRRSRHHSRSITSSDITNNILSFDPGGRIDSPWRALTPLPSAAQATRLCLLCGGLCRRGDSTVPQIRPGDASSESRQLGPGCEKNFPAQWSNRNEIIPLMSFFKKNILVDAKRTSA